MSKRSASHKSQNLALVKYDPSKLNLTAPVKKESFVPKRSKRFAHLNSPMSHRHFIYSHIGILLCGLLFLGGLYFILNSDTFTSSSDIDYLPVTQKPTTFSLEINNPEDELLTFNNSIVLSGSTAPKSTVIISVEGTETRFDSIEASIQGAFQRTISLKPGLNRIEITAFNLDGSSRTETKSVYYSEEALP